MHDYIQEADKPQDESPLRWLTPHPDAWRNYESCPWAKSILQIDPETDDLLLTPVTCKRWGCLYCARKKIRRLAFLTNGAQPNRMLTLGVDPTRWESPEAAWRGTSPKLPDLCKQIRVERGECEYLRVTELTKNGWPHYHALLRSSFIPQQRISELWATMTGAPVVDIRKITNSFSSFRYMVKYLTKLHKIDWTDRHVSYSRAFFREEDLEKVLWPEKTVLERIDEHPWLYLSNRYDTDTVGVDSQGNYHLPYKFVGVPGCYTRAHVGLEAAETTPPLPSYTQSSLPGLADSQQPRYDEANF